MIDAVGLSYEAQVKAIESMLKSVLGGAQFEYLSGPITGGPRFIKWQRDVGDSLSSDKDTYDLLFKRQVFEPNISELKSKAELLRKKGNAIIEPGSFESPNQRWSQGEFYRFWEQVITEHAQKVIFSEGWHLSVGCLYGYLCAVRSGKQCLAENFSALPVDAACEQIRSSVNVLPSDSARLETLKSRLLALASAIEFEDSYKAVK